MALRRAPLEEHRVKGPLSIPLLNGRLRVGTPGGTITLGAGELVALDAGVAHTAEALDDSALLITVAMPSTIRCGETCDARATPGRQGDSQTG